MTSERHSGSGDLPDVLLPAFVLVLLMLGYWFYPFPSGRRPDVWGFVIVWFKELIALALALFALVVAAWGTWSQGVREPDDAQRLPNQMSPAVQPLPSSSPVTSSWPDLPQTQLVVILLSTQWPPRAVGLEDIRDESADVELDGKPFKRLSAGGWLGFYDWLRDSTGRVVGVRQYIDDIGDFPWHRTFCGVKRGDGANDLLIFFAGEQAFDEDFSSDQDFGDNFLLANGDLIAITFSANGLRPRAAD